MALVTTVTEINILRGPVIPYLIDFAAATGSPPVGTDPMDITNQTVDFSSWIQFNATTDDGAKMTLNAEYHDTVVQEHQTEIESTLIRFGGTVSFDTQESDLLLLSAGFPFSTYTVSAAAGTNPDVLGFGDKAVTANKSLALAGDGPANTTNGQIWYFPKVRFESMDEVAMNKTTDRIFRWTYKILSDLERTAGERAVKVFQLTSA